MVDLKSSIEEGKRLGKLALYFGCWDNPGHYLHNDRGVLVYGLCDIPWDVAIMDSGFLRNAKVPDIPDGRVFWCCGGSEAFWYAFYWWDRSVDHRGACNSGFYVRGFGWPESREAFEYACEKFPSIVKRQVYRLVLQER